MEYRSPEGIPIVSEIQIIDANTARDYIARGKTAPPEERKRMSAALRVYAAATEKAETEAKQTHFQGMFTDPDYFKQQMNRPEMNDILSKSDDPEAAKESAAVRSFLSYQTGVDANINPDASRKGYSQSMFGKVANTDSELFGMIRGKYEGDKARKEDSQMLLGDVALSLWQGTEDGEPIPTSQFVQNYKETNPEFFAGLKPGEEAQVLSWLGKNKEELETKFKQYAPSAKRLYDEITSESGLKEGDGSANVIGELANMPEKDRQMLYSAVLMAAKRSGFESKKFLNMFTDSLSRMSVGSVKQTTRVMSEQALRSQLRMIEEGAGKGASTDAELAKKVETINDKLSVIKVLREVSQLKEEVDPIEATAKSWQGKLAQRSVLGVASAVPYMAAVSVPIFGMSLVFMANQARNYETLLTRNPNLSPEDAMEYATLISIPETALDRLKLEVFFPRAPRFVTFMRKISQSKKGKIGVVETAGKRYFTIAASETVIEVGQNSLPILVDQLGEALNEDFADHDLRKDLNLLVGSIPETIGTMMLISIVGAGAATIGDVKDGRFLLERTEPLTDVGISDEGAAKTVAAKSPEEALEILNVEYKKRTPENIAAGAEAANKRANRLKKNAAREGSPTMESREVAGEVDENGDPVYEYEVTDGKGEPYITRDRAVAESVYFEHVKESITRQTTAIGDSIAFVSEINKARGNPAKIRELLANAGSQSLLAEYEKNPTPDNLEKFFDLVESMPNEERPTDKNQLGGYFVRASNRGHIEDGIWHSIIAIHDGADGGHVIRDFTQDNLKEAMAKGEVTIEWVREQLAKLKTTKEFADMRIETNDDVIEAFSDVAMAYLTGRTKEEQIPMGLRTFLRQIAAAAREIFSRVYRLRREEAEGNLDQSFTELLAHSTGLDVDTISRNQGTREGTKDKQDSLDENRMANDGNPNFSISKAQDAEYMAAVESGDLDAAQRLVDSAAKAAGAIEGTAHHRGSFDPEIDRIPSPGKEGMHFGTESAANSRQVGAYVDNQIKSISLDQDEDGRWYWDMDGMSSEDINDDGFNTESEAQENAEQTATNSADSYEWEEIDVPMTNARLILLNPKRVEDQGSSWVDAVKLAKEEGYDSIIYKNQFEDKGSTSYIAFDPNQIKSAEAITRDSEGNVIPLSERFNPESDNINYSVSKADVTRHTALEAKHDAGTISPEETTEAEGIVAKVAKAAGFPIKAFHGSSEDNITVFDPSKAGEILVSDWGKGIYFAPRESSANHYQAGAAKTKSKKVQTAWDEMESAARGFGSNPMSATLDLNGGRITKDQYDQIKVAENKWRDARREVELEGEGKTYRVFLKIDTPYIYSWEGMTDPFLAERAKENGKDGIIIRDGVGNTEEIIAFDPNQIKSAEPFTGIPLDQRFDSTKDSINYSIGKEETPAISDRGFNEDSEVFRNREVFQSAQGFPSDEVKIPRWQASRQPEILTERVKAAQKRVSEAKKALADEVSSHIKEAKEWRKTHGLSSERSNEIDMAFIATSGGGGWNGFRRGSYIGRFTESEAEFIKRAQDEGYTHFLTQHDYSGEPFTKLTRDGKTVVESKGYDHSPFLSKKADAMRENLSNEEANLFLAMEEEGGRGSNLAAKESAAEWATRTKAANFAALLDSRDEKTRRAASHFISEVWAAFAKNDDVFQYGRTDSEAAEDIAEAVSAPGKPVTVSDRESQITFIGKEGSLTVHDADTDRPYIRSTDAKSQGKQGGGGSQLYAAALDWIHNNGKRIKDDSGLTSINATRRTSNFLASAIRHGTTKHLKPHVAQGLKWTRSDTLNIAALAAKEMENSFKAAPDAREWEYDFRTGKFRNDAGKHVTRKGFNAAVRVGDPAKSGIGLSTLQRAIITNSAIRVFERGGIEGDVLETAGSGVAPIGVTYSIGKEGADRVQAALDNRLNRNPAARLALYQRAKARLMEVLAQRGNSTDPNKKFASVLQAMTELNAILGAMPAEVRGKVGGFLQLANMAKDTETGNRVKTVNKFLEKRIEMIDKELEKVLRKEYRAKIERLVQASRPKKGSSGSAKSTLGGVVQDFANKVYFATLMDSERTADALVEKAAAMAEATDEKFSRLQEEWGIINTFGDLLNRPSETLEQAEKWLREQLKGGREARRITEQARIDDWRKKQQEIIGGLGESTRADANAQNHKTELEKLTSHIRQFGYSHKSFEGFLAYILPVNAQHIVAGWAERMRKGDNSTQDMEIGGHERLLKAIKTGAETAGISQSKALENLKEVHKDAIPAMDKRKVTEDVFTVEEAEKIVRGETHPGKLTKADLENLRDELANRQFELADKDFDSMMEGNENARHRQGGKHVRLIRLISVGNKQNLDFSKAQAMHLLLSWNQPDVQDKMRREGWTDESIEQAEKLTADPVSRSVMTFLKDFYSDAAGTVNPVYSRIFGMNIPQVKNYAPTRYESSKDDKEVGPDGIPMSSGSTPTMFQTRVGHSAKMKMMDALILYKQHVAMQSHWVNFAELGREVRAILLNPKVKASIIKTYGEPGTRLVNMWIDMMEQRGGDKAREIEWMSGAVNALIGGKAISLLGFNLKTIVAQIDSTVRFIAAVETKDMVLAFADPAALFKSMPKIWNSPTLQRRIKGGSNPVIQFMFTKTRNKPGVASNITEASMKGLNYGDAVFTTISSAVVFRASYTEAKAQGATEDQATDAALDAVDAAVYRFSQPVGFGSKSMVENSSNSILRSTMLFMSDPRLKMAIISDAVDGLRSGKGKKSTHLRRIFSVWIMAMMSEYILSLYRDWFTDDEDDDIWKWGPFIRASLLAPIQGYFFLGGMASIVSQAMIGEGWWPRNNSPGLYNLENAKRAYDGKENLYDPESVGALMKELDYVAKTISLTPVLAAPATILNLRKPIFGLKENLESDE